MGSQNSVGSSCCYVNDTRAKFLNAGQMRGDFITRGIHYRTSCCGTKFAAVLNTCKGDFIFVLLEGTGCGL